MFVFELLEGAAALLFLAIGAVIAGERGELAVLQFHNAGADPVQQRPVMGNQHQGPGISPQMLFQTLNARRVQIGGGLVRQQHLTFAGEASGDAPAGFFAAGKALPGGGRGKFAAQGGIQRSLGRVAELGDEADGGAPGNQPVVRKKVARQNVQKGGFSRAVFAHQAHPFAVVQIKIQTSQHRAQAVGLGNVPGFQKQFRHIKNLPCVSHGSAKKAANGFFSEQTQPPMRHENQTVRILPKAP